MSFTLNLLTFTKRENSTKVPTQAQINAGYITQCYILDMTSVMEPTLRLQMPSNPVGYNYAYMPDFGRYYHITDWSSDKDFWYATCTCDVLATYKSQIGASSEYVLRSASDYNTNILDELYPVTADISFKKGTFTAPGVSPENTEWIPWPQYGTYIIGVVNNSTTIKTGAVTYYAIPYYVMCNVMSFLLGSPSYMNIASTEVSQELTKALVNPIQYITEAFYIPYQITTPYPAETLSMGWWSLPSGGNYDATPIEGAPSASWTIGTAKTKLYIPTHPETSNRGRYLRCNPWSRYMLYAGPFGNIPLDPSLITKSDYIQLTVEGNPFGDVRLTIYDQYDYIIGKYMCNVKQQLTVGQVNNDPYSFQQGMLSIAGSVGGAMVAAAGGNIAGAGIASTGIVSGIMDNARNLYPQVQTTGTMNSASENLQPFRMVGEFHGVADADPTHRGRPLCEVKTLNTLSGYILVADPDISIAGTQSEEQKIKSYMSSGFYYE